MVQNACRATRLIYLNSNAAALMEWVKHPSNATHNPAKT